MQEPIAHTAFMVFPAAEAGLRPSFAAVLDAARTPAQEVPTAGRRRAAIARSRRELDDRFAALNPDDGVVIPPSQRPTGLMWRLHPAPTGSVSSPTGPEHAPAAAGAALAQATPGVRA